MKHIKQLVLILQIIPVFSACGETDSQNTSAAQNQFMATTIEVEISNKNCLAILLANDGTINRARSGFPDTADRDFFMGRTTEKVFDSLMATVSNDLLSYCNKRSPACDTTKQTCKVTISFSGKTSGIGCEYCINGTLNDLPKPIKDYVANAINVTEPWYQSQKRMTIKK